MTFYSSSDRSPGCCSGNSCCGCPPLWTSCCSCYNNTSNIRIDVIIADSITKVCSTDAGGDGVGLYGGWRALGGWLHWSVNAAKEDTGWETFSDHRGLCGGLFPRVIETRLARVTGLHLSGVPGVEGVTVGRISGEEAAT